MLAVGLRQSSTSAPALGESEPGIRDGIGNAEKAGDRVACQDDEASRPAKQEAKRQATSISEEDAGGMTVPPPEARQSAKPRSRDKTLGERQDTKACEHDGYGEGWGPVGYRHLVNAIDEVGDVDQRDEEQSERCQATT